jgi:hypothetical protein
MNENNTEFLKQIQAEIDRKKALEMESQNNNPENQSLSDQIQAEIDRRKSMENEISEVNSQTKPKTSKTEAEKKSFMTKAREYINDPKRAAAGAGLGLALLTMGGPASETIGRTFGMDDSNQSQPVATEVAQNSNETTSSADQSTTTENNQTQTSDDSGETYTAENDEYYDEIEAHDGATEEREGALPTDEEGNIIEPQTEIEKYRNSQPKTPEEIQAQQEENERRESISRGYRTINGVKYIYSYGNLENPENIAKLKAKVRQVILSGKHNANLTETQKTYQKMFLEEANRFIDTNVTEEHMEELRANANAWGNPNNPIVSLYYKEINKKDSIQFERKFSFRDVDNNGYTFLDLQNEISEKQLYVLENGLKRIDETEAVGLIGSTYLRPDLGTYLYHKLLIEVLSYEYEFEMMP